VSLANMAITGNSNGGIVGTSTTNFSLTDSTLTNNGSSAGEGAVKFTNLFGTSTLLGNVIGGSSGNNISVSNNAGSLNLTIADSGSDQAVMGTVNTAIGNDSINIQTSGNASLGVTVDGVDFQGARGDLIDIGAGGTSTQDIVITDNQFANFQATTGGGVNLGGDGSNINVDYQVANNVFTGATATALKAVYINDAGSIQGSITGNTIGLDDATAGSQGSSQGFGIWVGLDRTNGGAATYSVDIAGNEVRDTEGFGMVVTSGGSGSIVEARIDDNIVEEMGDFGGAFYAQLGGQGPGDTAQMGLDLTDNVFDASDAGFGGNAIILDQFSEDAHFYFPGYTGSANGEFAFPSGTASADLGAFLTNLAHNNTLIDGPFANFPDGVDAGIVTGVTGDSFTLAPWFP
jgi:hypothetical protein